MEGKCEASLNTLEGRYNHKNNYKMSIKIHIFKYLLKRKT